MIAVLQVPIATQAEIMNADISSRSVKADRAEKADPSYADVLSTNAGMWLLPSTTETSASCGTTSVRQRLAFLP